jgi:hypothetical protein
MNSTETPGKGAISLGPEVQRIISYGQLEYDKIKAYVPWL